MRSTQAPVESELPPEPFSYCHLKVCEPVVVMTLTYCVQGLALLYVEVLVEPSILNRKQSLAPASFL